MRERLEKPQVTEKHFIIFQHISCKFVAFSFLFPLFKRGSIVEYLISKIRRKRYKVSEIRGKYFKKVTAEPHF